MTFAQLHAEPAGIASTKAQHDLKVLDAVLTQLEDGASKDAEFLCIDDLAAKLRDYDIPSYRKGGYLIAYKERSKHGEFKSTLAALAINYQYASHLMRIAKAVAKYPPLKKACYHFTLLRKIAYASDEKQKQLADFFSSRDWSVESADEIRKLLEVETG